MFTKHNTTKEQAKAYYDTLTERERDAILLLYDVAQENKLTPIVKQVLTRAKVIRFLTNIEDETAKHAQAQKESK